MPNILSRLFHFDFRPKKAPPTQVNLVVKASYGTKTAAGVFDEEHIAGLSGPDWMATIDKMRRSDPQVKMVVNAVLSPLRKAKITINPFTVVVQGRFKGKRSVIHLIKNPVF